MYNSCAKVQYTDNMYTGRVFNLKCKMKTFMVEGKKVLPFSDDSDIGIGVVKFN